MCCRHSVERGAYPLGLEHVCRQHIDVHSNPVHCMAGFPPMTDSDGGMGFGTEDFFVEILFFCCLPLILLYFTILYFVNRKLDQEYTALESEKTSQ